MRLVSRLFFSMNGIIGHGRNFPCLLWFSVTSVFFYKIQANKCIDEELTLSSNSNTKLLMIFLK